LFLIHKPYYDDKKEKLIREKWEEAIGKEHILDLDDPKAVIDVTLGAIAITTGKRTLA